MIVIWGGDFLAEAGQSGFLGAVFTDIAACQHTLELLDLGQVFLADTGLDKAAHTVIQDVLFNAHSGDFRRCQHGAQHRQELGVGVAHKPLHVLHGGLFVGGVGVDDAHAQALGEGGRVSQPKAQLPAAMGIHVGPAFKDEDAHVPLGIPGRLFSAQNPAGRFDLRKAFPQCRGVNGAAVAL